MNIVKPGNLGTGLLIEYDAGHISPSESRNKKIIKEMKDNSVQEGPINFYAILQKSGVENRNGRVYPSDILRREVDRYQDLIKQGRALSELNHPESSLVDLERASHRITETFWDGETLMGKIEILTSPAYHKSGVVTCMGDIAANLLRYGVTLGISSRGVGSLKKENGKNMVQDDFELICFDLVSSPSTPGAYLFKDLDEKELYDESLNEKETPEELTKTLNPSLKLMNKLDSYLSGL
jgi:hypothetical protein|tara:strand:- start:2760 stop:3473 length:714 start_codon:yes stop_codon:yes gene_type:complete